MQSTSWDEPFLCNIILGIISNCVLGFGDEHKSSSFSLQRLEARRPNAEKGRVVVVVVRRGQKLTWASTTAAAIEKDQGEGGRSE